MIRRILPLAVIFACTSFAWIILGTTILARTYSPMAENLKSRVAASWGTEQKQAPPAALYHREVVRVVEDNKGATRTITANETVPLALDASNIDVTLDLSHRQKGLLWYSTYAVGFTGDYSFTNSSGADQNVTFKLNFPASEAVYDDLVMSVDNQPLPMTSTNDGAYGNSLVPAGKTVTLHTAYRSQGLDTWRYDFGEGVSQIRNFTLNMHTNFKGIDFPENTISPTTKTETSERVELNVELQKYGLRISNRDGDAQKAAARAARRTDQFLRSRFAVLLFLSDFYHHHCCAGLICIP